MNTHTDAAAPKKKTSFGQKLKNMFSKKKTTTAGGQTTVVEEKRETTVQHATHAAGALAQQQVIVPPGPVLVPAVMVPVVGAPQQNLPQPAPQPLIGAPTLAPIKNAIEQTVLTEKQAFGSIIESKAIPKMDLPPQQMMAAPAPIPVQQLPQQIVEAIPPQVVNQPAELYRPVGEILPEPVTLSVMGPVHQTKVIVDQATNMLQTKPLTGAGVPMESGGIVYNDTVIQANQGQFVNQGQAMVAPHLRNIVEITGTQPPQDLTYPRDLIVGPAVKTNPTFVENLPNLKKDQEYISRHLAEDNAAKPKPFNVMREYGKIPNPSYAGGKPFFVDMLYNPDPMVPLTQYPEYHQHLPLQVIGEKNAELLQINKMNEVAIKEHKEIMRNQDRM